MLFNFDLLFSLLYQRLVIDMLVYIFSYVIVEIVFIYHSDNFFFASVSVSSSADSTAN